MSYIGVVYAKKGSHKMLRYSLMMQEVTKIPHGYSKRVGSIPYLIDKRDKAAKGEMAC